METYRQSGGRKMREQVPSLSSSYAQPHDHEEIVVSKHVRLSPRRILSRATKCATALLKCQSEDGSWCGPLTGDTTLLCDYILLQLWLHPPAVEATPLSSGGTRIEKIVRSIWSYELPDGGWSLFPEGPPEINATVRAYTARRSPRMKRTLHKRS